MSDDHQPQYSDFQIAILAYLESEELIFQAKEQHLDHHLRKATHHSHGTTLREPIKVYLRELPRILPPEAMPKSLELIDVSQECRYLVKQGLLEQGMPPSYPGTEDEAYSITMKGGFFIRKHIYDSIYKLEENRRAGIIERLTASGKQEEELKKFISKLKDKSQDQIIDEILRFVKQYTVLGLHLVIVLVKESFEHLNS
jgi:hypothetical protein